MELAFFTAFIVKHIIADYFMQYSWMIKDKATYGAFGGLAHAGWHGILTLIVLIIFANVSISFILMLAFLDSLLHYHIDFVKSNVWKRKKLGPSDQLYWVTHGVDQLLHMLTYILILGLIL
tara:strand:- start:413 stop:775 length:363 start_codon:yes stop_codon:yes gene_type:complete